MTDTSPTPSSPPSASPSGVDVQRLLDSLVGIASARVGLEDGAVEEVHVLARPDTTREDVVQSVVSALRARFDLPVDPTRIFVARIQEAGAERPGGAGGSTAADEEERPDRTPAGRPPPGEPGPPPWPERSPAELGAPDPEERLESSSSRRVGTASEGLESRLLFLGHRTAKRRSEEVQVGVELQWRGRRLHGTASVRDRSPERLEAPALATLRAVDVALEGRAETDTPADLSLALRGVEMVEALGQRHVMVSVLATVGSRTTPLTGTVIVDDSVELATILATLQATDRRVRAVLLNHFPGNGGPPGGR